MIVTEDEIIKLIRDKYNVPSDMKFIHRSKHVKVANTSEGSMYEVRFDGYEIVDARFLPTSNGSSSYAN